MFTFYGSGFAKESINNCLNTNAKETPSLPIAVNDTFILAVGCNNYEIKGNLMDNDIFNPDSAWISQAIAPQNGAFLCSPTGDFDFVTETNFRGEVSIDYKISNIENASFFTVGKLTIYIEDDFDCDNVVNSIDLDDDNDGIIDLHEGGIWLDSDNDGIANCYDIDSDNDGITDFTEWQSENSQIALLLSDENSNGWDDAFDSQTGGIYYEQIDTDMDGTPDFLDTDSDNDGISDFVEAYDILNDRSSSLYISETDYDADGLDDSFDTANREASKYNSIESNSPLPDYNNNGIRDWRDSKSHTVEVVAQNAMTSGLRLSAYPSPFVNRCTVVIPNTEDFKTAPYSLKIYDVNGRLVHIELLYQHQSTLQLDDLRKGVYILRVQTVQNTFSTQLIKSE